MITLYTAVGNFKLNKDSLPTVVSCGQEYALDSYELIIWSSLAFHVLTYRELRKCFYDSMQELHILTDRDFDRYLNRLTARKLIVSGTDYTGADALYDLLGSLHVQSVPNNRLVQTVSFFKLLFLHHFPLEKALSVFQASKLDPIERLVLSLVQHQTLSTAELISCNEKNVFTLDNNEELMDLLYSDERTDCESIVTDARLYESRYQLLSAITSLYLKQKITLHLV